MLNWMELFVRFLIGDEEKKFVLKRNIEIVLTTISHLRMSKICQFPSNSVHLKAWHF